MSMLFDFLETQKSYDNSTFCKNSKMSLALITDQLEACFAAKRRTEILNGFVKGRAIKEFKEWKI